MCPSRWAPPALVSNPARSPASTRAGGSRNVITTVEPGASVASRRRVAAVVSLPGTSSRRWRPPRRAGPGRSPAARARPTSRLSARSRRGRSAGAAARRRPTSVRRRCFQAWVPGWSISNTRSRSSRSGRRSANVSRPAPRSTYWSTPASEPLGDELLDEPGARHDGGPERRGAHRIHVGPIAPPVGRIDQAQPDDVVEHVRRIVDQHVQGTPQRGAYGGVVRLLVHRGGHYGRASRRRRSSAPAESRRDVAQHRLDQPGVVLDAELVRHGEQERVGGGDCFVTGELLDEHVRLGRVAASEDRSETRRS